MEVGRKFRGAWGDEGGCGGRGVGNRQQFKARLGSSFR